MEEKKEKEDVKKNMDRHGNLIQAKYTKKPIVYEGTGAMGKGAKAMLKKVMLKLKEEHPRLDSHWGATSFKAHWMQKFATHLAKSRTRVIQETRFARKTKEWSLTARPREAARAG